MTCEKVLDGAGIVAGHPTHSSAAVPRVDEWGHQFGHPAVVGDGGRVVASRLAGPASPPIGAGELPLDSQGLVGNGDHPLGLARVQQVVHRRHQAEFARRRREAGREGGADQRVVAAGRDDGGQGHVALGPRFGPRRELDLHPRTVRTGPGHNLRDGRRLGGTQVRVERGHGGQDTRPDGGNRNRNRPGQPLIASDGLGRAEAGRRGAADLAGAVGQRPFDK